MSTISRGRIRKQKRHHVFKFFIVLIFLSVLGTSSVHAVTELLFVTVVTELTSARLDPLTNPGSCSGHVHSVFGSSSFSDTVTEDDVTDDNWQDDTGKINQTTSHIIPNKSMYWAPSLYIHNPNDQLYYIVPSFARVYYRIDYNEGNATTGEAFKDLIKPFPPFLRLIVGDASRIDNYWERGDIHDNIRWTNRTNNRRDTNSNEHGDWNYLLQSTSQDIAGMKELEMNTIFPQCLQTNEDGAPFTSSDDFRSHASYQNPIDRICPDDFPYHIPTLNVEVRYYLNKIRKVLGDDVVNNVANWRLSTGDTSGAGAHVDFISGWPVEFMENAIDHRRLNIDATGLGKCPTAKYEGQTQLQDKRIPFTNKVPDEAITAIASLPNVNSYCSVDTTATSCCSSCSCINKNLCDECEKCAWKRKCRRRKKKKKTSSGRKMKKKKISEKRK